MLSVAECQEHERRPSIVALLLAFPSFSQPLPPPPRVCVYLHECVHVRLLVSVCECV